MSWPGYFFAWQALVEACQSPPAASQSAWFVIVDSDLPVVPPDDGLAEGDVDGPVDGAGIDPEPVVPELPEDPGVLLDPPAPGVPLPVAPPV